MQWFVLVALLTAPANPVPHPLEGIGQRTFVTLAQCEARRRQVADYLAANVKNPRVKTSVFCVRVAVEGYLEGVDNLRRKTGDLS